MRNWLKKNYKHYLCLITSIIILAIVNVLFNNSNFGSDSIFCLNQGVAKALGIKLGYANLMINGLFLVIMLIINRKSIGVGTILMIAFLGVLINLVLKINIIPNLASIELPKNFEVVLQITYILLALALGGFAISLYIYINRGLSPFEGVTVKLSQVTKIPFWVVKIITDVIFFVIGYLLGGVIGVGSIIAALLYGPSISLFGKIWKKFDFLKENKNEKTK